jgi:hypothetical protein
VHVSAQVRDELLLADLAERKKGWLSQLTEWTPVRRKYELARDQIRRYANTVAARAQLSSHSPPSSPPQQLAEQLVEINAATQQAAVALQRVIRGRNTRRFWQAHKPSEALAPKPRFRTLVPEEHIRKLVIKGDLYTRMGKVPYRLKLGDDGRPAPSHPGEAKAQAVAPTSDGGARAVAALPAPSLPLQPPVQ